MSTPARETPGPELRATRREWVGLAAIALPCAVYAMDLTVLNLAIPAIAASLQPSASQLLWIIDIYGFLVAGFLITMGNLGDRIGRRRLLLVGAAAFALASVGAALARSAEMLVLMRALLGIAGATLAPSTMSLIRNMFHHPQERQFAIGVWIAGFSLGAAIGPLVGGVLLQWFHWSAVFWAAVPVMLLVLVLGPRLIPEYRDPQAGPIDGWSALQSLAAVLSLIYGIKHLAEHGPSAAALGALVAGAAMGVVFLRRQRRLPHPLLDLALFSQPRFAAAISAYALSCLATMGVYIFVTQHLQGVLALSPLHAGLATLPWALSWVAGSLLAPRLARQVPPATLLVGGLAMAVPGFLLLTLADGPHALAWLIAGTVLMSLATAPVFTIGNEIIITSAPPERAGAASAIAETAAEFSGALGIAVFGSLGMMFYRWRLDALLPGGMPASARATLGGALEASAAQGGAAGAALRDGARAAFTDTLQLSAVAGAAIVLLACALAARILRARPPAAAASAGSATQAP